MNLSTQRPYVPRTHLMSSEEGRVNVGQGYPDLGDKGKYSLCAKSLRDDYLEAQG